ncbi:MAG: DNA topoisomerase I [Candidatus Ranarchaeia archaeon]
MPQLIITEKPTAAKRIASALSLDKKIKEQRINNVPFYEVKYKGEQLFIVSALGHLFGLKQQTKGWTYPIFDYEWLPLSVINKKDRRKSSFINLIKQMGKKSTSYISACDFDLEGSLIAYNILKFCIGDEAVKSAKRMRFSTLTDEDLRNSYENMLPNIDMNMINAAKTRHELDWLFGINLSRALTTALKKESKSFKILSTGRVQGPLLKFIAEREFAIQTFIPIPFWEIKAKIKLEDGLFPIFYVEPKIPTREKAKQIISDCKNQPGVIKDIIEKDIQLNPPPPFNLGDLQHAAYALFRFHPKRTLNIAAKLYLESLISYPRTDSQQIPKSINLKQILLSLQSITRFRPDVKMLLQKQVLRVNNGMKKDPAHPALHPTGVTPKRRLKFDEWKIYELISRRFFASMGDVAVKKTLKVVFDVNNHKFFLNGEEIKKVGWLIHYKPFYRSKDSEINNIKIGESYEIKNLRKKDIFTSPLNRFNPNTLVKIMEREKIGTKSTRADISELMFKRGFVSGTQTKISELGLSITDSLDENCPMIQDVQLTREIEEQIQEIRKGKMKKEKTITNSKKLLIDILTTFKKNEEEIGKRLGIGLKKSWKNESAVGSCPDCKEGQLILITNPKTRKRFVGCTNYKNGCKTSFPMTSKGTIKPLNKPCPHCGYPMIGLRFRRGKMIQSCVNWIKCPGNKKESKK